MTRELIAEVLQKGVAVVTFTKVDGSLRKMKCTLIPSILPALKGSNHKRSQEVLPVWDLDKDAWRSFRIDSVISVEPVA